VNESTVEYKHLTGGIEFVDIIPKSASGGTVIFFNSFFYLQGKPIPGSCCVSGEKLLKVNK
jgi:hypothetical protein